MIRKYGLYTTAFSTDFSLVKVVAAWKRLVDNKLRFEPDHSRSYISS